MIFPEPIDAAIFDFDETMVDLEAQHAAAFEALARSMGAEYSELPESIRLASGRRIIDDIRDMRHFFRWSEPEESLFRRRQELFDELCAASDVALLPGVERVVRELHARDIPLAIASSAVRSSIEAVLRRTNVRDCFRLIVDGSDVTHGKPDPEVYRITAEKLQVDAKRCLVFEDSQIGVLAAKRAGMHCIAVRNPHAKVRQDLSAADRILASFEVLDPAWLTA